MTKTKKELVADIMKARPDDYHEHRLLKMKKSELEGVYNWVVNLGEVLEKKVIDGVEVEVLERDRVLVKGELPHQRLVDEGIMPTTEELVEQLRSTETPLNAPQTAGKGESGTNTHSEQETENVAQYCLVNSKGVVKGKGLTKQEAEELSKSTGYSIQTE